MYGTLVRKNMDVNEHERLSNCLLMDKIKRKHITSKRWRKASFNNNKTIAHQIRFYQEKGTGIIIYRNMQMHPGPD
jgi:hypothetical protein